MNTVEAMPFSENALRRIAQIIIKKYRNQQDEDDDITSTASLYDALFPGRRNTRNFFARAGCLKDFIDTDEVLNSTFLSLAKVQTYPDGKAKLIRIIEQLCDPEEYFDNPESREVVIKQINEVLSRYYLKVAMSGKVYKRVTSPLQVGLDNATSDLNTIQSFKSIRANILRMNNKKSLFAIAIRMTNG